MVLNRFLIISLAATCQKERRGRGHSQYREAHWETKFPGEVLWAKEPMVEMEVGEGLCEESRR